MPLSVRVRVVRSVLALALIGAGLVAGALGASYAWERARDARDAREARAATAAWPADRAAIEAALAAVSLPRAYRARDCDVQLDRAHRCWVREGVTSPESLVPDAVAALRAAKVAHVASQCEPAPGNRIACTVYGTVASRRIAVALLQDVNPNARSLSEHYADAVSVYVGADLSAP